LGFVVRSIGRRHRRNRFGEKGLIAIMLVNQFLFLAAVIFCIGVYGVIARKNAVLVLMSIELILNSVNLNLVAFSMRNGSVDGQTFALYVIAVAAAEVGVGLGLVLLVYRNRRSISLDDLSEMKG
jgi:NADH:ubiquinone oxidoreductase subunit K